MKIHLREAIEKLMRGGGVSLAQPNFLSKLGKDMCLGGGGGFEGPCPK